MFVQLQLTQIEFALKNYVLINKRSFKLKLLTIIHMLCFLYCQFITKV